MSQPRSADARSDVFMMLISAAIFGYFGFVNSWAHQMTAPAPPATPQLLPMVVLLKWSLRGGAIVFGISALISFAGSVIGPLLYAAAGLITALCFLAVAIWEWTNPAGYYSGVPAILLLVFAIWNGWGSWSSLRAMMASRGSGSRPGGLPDDDAAYR